jgi:acetyl esterase
VIEPGIQQVLDAMNALQGPPAHEVPVEQARAGHEQETERLGGPGEEVGKVEHVELADGIRARLYTPREPSGGVISYFHGGGWVVGSLDSFDTACRALTNATGATVASVDYRLAPEHRFPAALDDCTAATAALADGDEPVAVAGDSAGGNLAIGVARRLRDRVRAMALVYPVTDAGLNTPSYRDFKERYGLTAAGMQRYWNLYLDGVDGLQPDASPLRADDLAGLPPTYALTAEFDVLRDEGEAFVAKLREAGVDVTHRRFEGTIHGFWRWMAATPRTREAASDCTTSSVTTAPALRITCASPSLSPSTRSGSRRASMQQITAMRRAGTASAGAAAGVAAGVELGPNGAQRNPPSTTPRARWRARRAPRAARAARTRAARSAGTARTPTPTGAASAALRSGRRALAGAASRRGPARP